MIKLTVGTAGGRTATQVEFVLHLMTSTGNTGGATDTGRYIYQVVPMLELEPMGPSTPLLMPTGFSTSASWRFEPSTFQVSDSPPSSPRWSA